jgi:hypothetical protein
MTASRQPGKWRIEVSAILPILGCSTAMVETGYI